MHRRLALLSAFLAVALAFATPSARANEKFIIFFPEWSAEVDPAAQDVVAAAAAYAKANRTMAVEVHGFASSGGSQKANLYLTLLRAQVVNDLLVAGGVDIDRVSRVGEGAVSSVGSPQEARRVEIVVRAR